MKYLSIIISILSILFIASCKEKSNDTAAIIVPAQVDKTHDTLVYKSTARVDSVDFIILRANPSTTLITMADSVIPNINDSIIALCVEGAFTGELLDEFKSSNVAGDYVINGKLRKGYKCKANTGLLCTINGRPIIAPVDKCKEWIKKAVKSNGILFQQMLLIEKGKNVYRGSPIKPASQNIYRAACIVDDGNFAVIQSQKAIPLGDFINALVKLGVAEALYLDMGTGWNYGWYRETENSPAVKLFNIRSPYQTNWLLVKERQLVTNLSE